MALTFGFCKFNTLQKTPVCSMVCLCVKTNVICISNLNIYVIFLTYFLTAPFVTTHNSYTIHIETHTKYIIIIYYRNFFSAHPILWFSKLLAFMIFSFLFFDFFLRSWFNEFVSSIVCYSSPFKTKMVISELKKEIKG